MHRIAAAIALPVVLTAGATLQISAQQGTAQQQPSPDPGVTPTRLLDRDEIRITRVELAAGAVRSAHAHDDVEYHVWVPMTGTFEIAIEKSAPVKAASGQAFFMKRGTPHVFRNTGSTPAAVLEIFVKRGTLAAGGLDAAAAAALAMATLR